jgi:hypothetical protein
MQDQDVAIANIYVYTRGMPSCQHDEWANQCNATWWLLLPGRQLALVWVDGCKSQQTFICLLSMLAAQLPQSQG